MVLKCYWVGLAVVVLAAVAAAFAAAALVVDGKPKRRTINEFSMVIIVTGMIFKGHTEHGFFMNWSGNQAGEGFEYHILAIGIAIAILITGSGKYSLDNKLFASEK